MPSVQVSVAQAAEVLGVHPQRIHQRIREGSLPAEKLGNQWVVEMSDLRRINRHTGPGRPLSPKSAWDLLAIAASDQAASQLSPSARSRARSRLRSLLVHASSRDPEDVAVRLARALGNRAERALFVASPRDLLDVGDDERVHLSGVSLPESNMSVTDVAEGYAYRDDLKDLISDYLLSAAPRSRANVIVHLVPSAVDHPALADLDEVAHSSLAIAADLAEHDGVRERSEAIRSLADLQTRLVARETPGVGGDRG